MPMLELSMVNVTTRCILGGLPSLSPDLVMFSIGMTTVVSELYLA